NEDGNNVCVTTASTAFPTGSVNVATISQDTTSSGRELERRLVYKDQMWQVLTNQKLSASTVTRWVTLQESAEHPEVRKEEGKKAVAQLEGRLTEYKEWEVKYIEKIRILEMYRASNLKSIKIISKELEEVKLEKDGVDGKLTGLLKASKNLDHLIESQRSNQVKEGVGYNVVPPPAADLYLSPKKDLL
nr:hypothetical protein [Tanacetum cinerariifolium]